MGIFSTWLNMCAHSLKARPPAFIIYLVRCDISSVIYALFGPSLGEYVIFVKLCFNANQNEKTPFPNVHRPWTVSGVCILRVRRIHLKQTRALVFYVTGIDGGIKSILINGENWTSEKSTLALEGFIRCASLWWGYLGEGEMSRT